MGTATIDKPDEIKCTLKFTMKLSDWKDIREKINAGGSSYVGNQVTAQITDLVCQLEHTFYSDVDGSIKRG